MLQGLIIASDLVPIVAADGGIIALATSIATLVVIKSTDFFLGRKGDADKFSMQEATAIRHELREEAGRLRDDLKAILAENDEQRRSNLVLLEQIGISKVEAERSAYQVEVLTHQLTRVSEEVRVILAAIDDLGLDGVDARIAIEISKLKDSTTIVGRLLGVDPEQSE